MIYDEILYNNNIIILQMEACIMLCSGCHVRLPSSYTLAQVTGKYNPVSKIQGSEHAAKTDKEEFEGDMSSSQPRVECKVAVPVTTTMQ